MTVLARVLPKTAGWPIWLLGAVGMLLCGGLVAGVVGYAAMQHAAALDDSKRELRNAALLLAEHTSRAMHAVELTQTNILGFIRSTRVTTPQEFRDRLSKPDVHEFLKHELSGHPQANAFTLIDADGTLRNSTRSWPIPSVSIADRTYFRALKSNPALTELITEPVRNRGDGTWTAYVARKVMSPSGQFLGLVLGALDLGYFENVFGAVDLRGSNVFGLFRDDGTLLARWPRIEETIGQRYLTSIGKLGAETSAVFEFDAPTDGMRRLTGVHRVRNYPLFVTAGLDKDRALASWRNETMMLAAAAAVACLAVAGLLGVAMWYVARLRRRDREQLAGKEAQLDAALNNMAHGLAMFDARGCTVLCNERYGEMLSLPPEVARPGAMLEDVVAYSIANGLVAGDSPRIVMEQVFAELAQGRTSVRLMETSDGRTLRVVDRPKPDGGWVATFEDITLQRQAERERDQNQAFLRAVLDSVPGAIFVKDARTLRYVFVNRTAERYLDGSRQSLQGKTAADAFPKDSAAVIAMRDRAALQSRTPTSSEGHMLETALGTRTLNTTRVPILESNGEPQFLLGVVEDVTDRKRAEAAERRNAALVAATIAAMADGVIVVDADGQVLLRNPAAAAMFGEGIQATDLAWTSEFERLRPDGTALPAEESPVHRAVRGEVIDNDELLLKRRKDGALLHMVVSSRPLRDASGALQSVIVFRDVTESREVERQLRQAQKMDAVGQLTGGIAHDFNNILTVITTTIDILANAVADRPTALTITNMISQAADRGSQLTKHLLAFARKQPLQPRDTNVNALVLETTTLLKATLGEHIQINAALDPGAWHALVDPSQLTTTLLNLAVNARDAMPDGGTLTVETANLLTHPQDHAAEWQVPAGEYVILAVTDTGTGIPEAIRDKVFDPFFTTKGAGKGTGLGLSMVYGFVKQSGGHVRIDSEEGRGTAIRIYLPRAAECPLAEQPDIAASPGGHETVLVVEDDALVRQQATRLLKSLGYATTEAAGPAEALAMIDAGTEFDLLFTDVIMPGMNGWQLAEQVRDRRPGARVLFASGYTENTMLSGGRIPDGVLLLSKPYRRHELAGAVRQALARSAVSSAA